MAKLELDNKEFLKGLGNRIRTIRKEKNMKQVELASLCDTNKQVMSRIELGDSNAAILTLKKIAIALEVDISDLLKNI